MVPKAITIKASSLVLDHDLYPRHEVQSYNVHQMVESLEAGAELPPVLADRKSKRVIDGWHRIKAHLRHLGPDADIEVILKAYESEAEMYVEAMALNAPHGTKLTAFDRVRCIVRAKELGIDEITVAKALNITVQKVGEIKVQKLGLIDGKQVPLKRTSAHFAGREMTKEQVEGNEKAGGPHQLFFVNQVMIMLESDTVNWDNEQLIKRLRELHELLGNTSQIFEAVPVS